MKLGDKEWRAFYIGKLYSVKRPIARNIEQYLSGAIPFVTSGSLNNGVLKCCEPQANERLDRFGCITVSPVDGSAFYQPYHFLGRGGAGSSILMLYDDNPNINVGQFIAKMITKTCSLKYTYGRMGNKDGVSRERIMLPINNDGSPDREYMSSYVKSLKRNLLARYKRYVEEQLSKLEYKDIPGLDEVEWKVFFFNKVFDEPKRGKRIVNENHEFGNTPLVSSQGTNNGVTGFIGNTTGVRRFCHCLSIANGGSSAGKCYYQPFEFVGADHVTQVGRAGLNTFQYLFLSQIISKGLIGKYGFSHEIKDKALSREKIMLPVNTDGQPDYAYMEQYAKNLMFKKYQQYLSYLNRHAE